MSRTELKQEIAKVRSNYLNLQAELTRLEERLKCYRPKIWEAVEGETVEDGSILAIKSDKVALLVAPANTELCHSWYPHLISHHGLDPSSQWFIPDIETLAKVMVKVPNAFSSGMRYWSSSPHTESEAWSSTLLVTGNTGYRTCRGTTSRDTLFLVRAFRAVLY